MSERRIPIIATIVVVLAVAIMIALGFWHLGRLDEKEALIARYAANEQLPEIELEDLDSLPAGLLIDEGKFLHLESALFRRVRISCDEPTNWKAVAGRNSDDQAGYVHMFECHRYGIGFMDGGEIEAALFATIGWSRSPQEPEWGGGTVHGILSTAGNDYEVVASDPFAGLEPVAAPDPSSTPNNHLAYAGQWFFFAFTALVIYILALRRRWR